LYFCLCVTGYGFLEHVLPGTVSQWLMKFGMTVEESTEHALETKAKHKERLA